MYPFFKSSSSSAKHKKDKQKTLGNVLRMFEEHCEPVKNIICERIKFNSLRQGELSIHQSITALQSQADVCNYGEMRNKLVRGKCRGG